ncbi:hydrolase, TatD family protein, partial [Toxoplasma gondii MAS]
YIYIYIYVFIGVLSFIRMKVTRQREKESSEKHQVNLHPCGVFRSAKRRSTMHSATRGGAVLSRFRRFFLCALFFLETVVRAMHPADSLSKSGAISVSARKRLFSCFQAPLARFSFCKTARAPQTPKTRRPSSFSPCGPRSFSPSPVSRSSFSLPVSLFFPLGLLSSVHRSAVFPLLPARLGGDFECNWVQRIDFSFLRSTFCRASSLSFSAPPSATRFLSLNRVAGKRYLSSRTQTGVPDNWHTMEGRAQPAFVDIGANLTDDMYRGFYFGKERHPADLERSGRKVPVCDCGRPPHSVQRIRAFLPYACRSSASRPCRLLLKSLMCKRQLFLAFLLFFPFFSFFPFFLFFLFFFLAFFVCWWMWCGGCGGRGSPLFRLIFGEHEGAVVVRAAGRGRGAPEQTRIADRKKSRPGGSRRGDWPRCRPHSVLRPRNTKKVRPSPAFHC